MKLRALIADDEAPSRMRIRHLLAQDADIEIVGEAASGKDALHAIRTIGADVVFLDIQMPGLDGFAVLEELDAGRPVVVFVTAFDMHAVRAFEVHALDYLLKPVRPERMQQTLQRVRKAIAQGRIGEMAGEMSALAGRFTGEFALPKLAQVSPTASQGVERLAVDARGRTLFIKVDDIDWIGAEENYARVHVGKESYLMRSSLRALEESLDPRRFVRIHRGTIVNLDRVVDREYWSSGDYNIRLRNGQQLRLSRNYREQFDDAIGRPRGQ